MISDRGPIGGAGGGALAPVTTLSLDWEWDFTNPSKARCHVEAVFRTETAQTTFPLARSLQISVARRSGRQRPANGYKSIEFPGLGTVSIRCEPGEPRQIRVESAAGAKITTREASEDSSITEGAGPVVANLPNNGMVVVEMASGQRIIVASRWKLNDPNPANNSCSIAGQVASPGFPGVPWRVAGKLAPEGETLVAFSAVTPAGCGRHREGRASGRRLRKFRKSVPISTTPPILATARSTPSPAAKRGRP